MIFSTAEVLRSFFITNKRSEIILAPLCILLCEICFFQQQLCAVVGEEGEEEYRGDAVEVVEISSQTRSVSTV